MGTPGPDPTITLDATLAVFAGRERAADPLTASEVAERLDCSRRTAHRKLQRLAESGDIETKKVGARSRIWWRPAGIEVDGGSVSGTGPTTQFDEFVRAVEDYAIFTLDAEGNVDTWNAGAERIKGYPQEEIVGEHFSTFYTAEERRADVPQRNLERAQERGRCEDEGWRVRRDGSEFYANVVITAIFDDDGSLQGFTKVTRDITDRRRTRLEDELNVSVSRSITEAETVHDGLESVLEDVCTWTDWSLGVAWLADGPDSARLSATHASPDRDIELDAARSTRGAPPGELTRRVLETRAPVWEPDVGTADLEPGDHPGLPDDVAVQGAFGVPVMADGEISAVLEFYLCERRNRDDRLIDVVGSVAADLGGTVARRRAELQAERERRLTEQLFETVPAVVGVVDPDGTIVRTNSRFRAAFGVEDADRDLDVDTPDIYDPEGALVPPEERPTRRALRTGEPVRDEVLRFSMPDRQDRWYSVNAVPLRDEAADGEYAVFAATDVDELRESKRALERRTGELEAELNEVFGRVSDSVFAVDDEWRLSYVNQQAIRFLGAGAPRQGADLVGRTLWEVLPAARDVELRERFEDAMATQESRSFEAYLPELEAWLEIRAHPSQTGVSVYFRDVTDQLQRQRELEQYGRIVETVQDGVYTVDTAGRFTMVNDAYTEMTGRTREELLGAHVSEVVDRETIEAAQRYERQLNEGDREGAKIEADLVRKDGSTIRAEATFALLPGDDEEYERVGVVRDVSERVARKRELEQYETVFENVRDGVYITDEDRRFTLVNDAYCALTGLDREAVIGEPISTVVGEEAATRTSELLEEMVAGEREIEAIAGNHNAPDDRTLESWFVPLPLDDGEFTGTTGVIRDVTERERREERLRALSESARSFLRDDSVDAIGETCLRASSEILDIPGVGLYHHDREEGVLVPRAVSTDEDFMRMELPSVPPDGRSLVGQVFTEGSTRRFDDILEQPQTSASREQTEMRSGVFAPIGEYGVLVCGAREVDAFGVETERLVELLAATAEAAFERLDQERELRRYETLIEKSTDVNAIVDQRGEIQYATPSAAYVLGYEPADLEGEPAFEYIHPDDRDGVEGSFGALIGEETITETVEFRFRHADGWWVWLEARGRNLADDPTIDGLVIYTRDVTDRKEYELALERRRHAQEVIAELGRTALQTENLDALFADATQRVAEVLDTEYCTILELDETDDRLHLRQGVGWREDAIGRSTVAAGENNQAGFTLEAGDPVVVEDLSAEERFGDPELPTDHDVRSGISTVIGSPEDPWGILATHDTAQRGFSSEDVNLVQTVANTLAEAIRRQSYRDERETLIDRLEESNERLEQFAHIASHDLQEPLRMVSGYLQLIEARYADALDEDGEEFIEFAVDGADRMREMISDLLQYSRLETRGEPFEETDLAEAVERACLNLAVQIGETDATVDVGDLPTVEADRNQLEQLLQNLVSNAIKYRGDAPPAVEIYCADRDRRSVTIAVADNGIGMNPEHTDQVFAVFERLHTQEEYAGTGIGLALCKKIVERHGGDIWVESAPEEGSTFYFTLPRPGSGPAAEGSVQ